MSIYFIAFGFVVSDYITGLCKAFAKKSFESRIMREGLWHKSGLVLLMLLAFMVDYAQRFVDLGIKVPVGTAVCIYIIMMEMFSALENICKITPDLMPEKIMAIFGGNTISQKKENNQKLEDSK